MNLSTTAIYLMIWLLPTMLVGQVDNGQQSKIRPVGNADDETGFRKKILEEAQTEETSMSLDLIRLRLLIAEEEKKKLTEGSNWFNGVNEKVLARLKFKEAALSEAIGTQQNYVALLEKTLYWPASEREKVLFQFTDRLKQEKSLPLEILADEDVQGFTKKNYKPILPKYDLIENPPSHPCQIVESNADMDSNGPGRQTVSQLLFSHTDQKLEIHFPKRDFISGYASLAIMDGGVKTLDLVLSIASPKANSIFGAIRQRDHIVIKLLDGTEVDLHSQMTSNGHWDVTTQSFLYHGRYLIGIKEERLLRKNEADKISIRWSKAQEEYEIFEMDFFIKHFACLENGL